MKNKAKIFGAKFGKDKIIMEGNNNNSCELYWSNAKEDFHTDWFDIQPSLAPGEERMGRIGTPKRQQNFYGEENALPNFECKDDFPSLGSNALLMWQESDDETQQRIESEIHYFQSNIQNILSQHRMQCEFMFGLRHPDDSFQQNNAQSVGENAQLHAVPESDYLTRTGSKDSISDASLHTYYEPADQSFESDATLRFLNEESPGTELNKMALQTLTLAAQVFRRLSQLYIAK